MTVLDMLQKAGVEDNISFYNENRGKKDFILNLVWHRDFNHSSIQGHLTSSTEGERKDQGTSDTNMSGGNTSISISDCFEKFREKEFLDENNMWYCNKCKEHV